MRANQRIRGNKKRTHTSNPVQLPHKQPAGITPVHKHGSKISPTEQALTCTSVLSFVPTAKASFQLNQDCRAPTCRTNKATNNELNMPNCNCNIPATTTTTAQSLAQIRPANKQAGTYMCIISDIAPHCEGKLPDMPEKPGVPTLL
jgi:hypothetical protein